MASPLADLDELVLKCRDEKAKSYIKEAVSCYKSGAFRSAIVSTWIAVSFDIIDKIRELSLAGDKEADVQLKAFEKARDEGGISHSLKFEREMLEVCRDKLELISYLEFIDLARLQEDRNRCAHPSMTSDSQIFSPSAELARVHIRSAVEYLLQYPPAQGKSAMDIILKEVNSKYFPVEKSRILVALKNSPLFKARKSLVRNFIVVILKDLLKTNFSYQESAKLSSVLNAVEELYKEIYDSTLNESLSGIFRRIDDGDLYTTFNILNYLPSSWDFLDDDVQDKIKSVVRNLPVDKMFYIFIFINHKGIGESAEYLMNLASVSDLDKASFFILPKKAEDKIVDSYVKSANFSEANAIASTIEKYAHDFTLEQIKKIIGGCVENDQIYGSNSMPLVLKSLRKNENISNKVFDLLLLEGKIEL